MEPFGPFEVTRELDTSDGATVYKARKEGDPKNEYIVKVFSLERLVSEEGDETQSELDPLFKDIGASFTSRINLQKQAAEGSPLFVPILAAGHDGRGAWYVTHFYARTVKGMLDRFVALESRDLHHVALSVVRAARHLKQMAGRSHGNLKASNIFIDGAGRPRSSRVLVSDPLAGDEHDAAGYELADLRAVGELIYQLVLRRKVDFSTGWVILPIEASREWTELFEKQTPAWLSLCNRLLDPRLSLEQYSLAQLESDLLKLKPKRPVAVTAIPVAAVVLIAAGIAGYYFWHAQNYGRLALTTDPPGAKVVITPINVYGNEETNRARTRMTPTAPAARPRPLELSLKQGNYHLVAEYEANNGTLRSRSVRLSVKAGATTRTNLYMPHGTLVVLSQPAGARVMFGKKPGITPYTNLFLKAGEVSITVQLTNYLPAMWSGKVQTNAVAVVRETLEKIQAGHVNVTFASEPPGATIRLNGGPPHTSPWITGLEDGKAYTVTAQLSGWPEQTKGVQFALRNGVNRTNEFVFPYGILRVGDTEPPGAEIWVDGKLVEHAPQNIPLPLKPHEVMLKAAGYSNYTARVVLPGLRQAFSLTRIHLAPMAGFVRLITDPRVAGIEITDRSTGKLVARTTARDLQPVLPLPPTNYVLVASQPELGRVQAGVRLKAGQTNSASFVFSYGTVVLGSVEPKDVAAAAQILGANQRARVGEPIYQRPGQRTVYEIEAPGYQTRYFTNAVPARQTVRVAATLSRLLVPFRLTSQPPGARFFTGDGNAPRFDGVNYWLPWGQTKLIARLGGLEPIARTLELQWNKTNVIPVFDFGRYAMLVLTNLPDDITVKEGNQELTPQPGALRFAYDKPGTHTYELYESGIKVDTVTTNLPAGMRVVLQSEVAGREFRNSVGMAFMKVPNLFGPGKDGWVGKTEVTQAQYERVMGRSVNPSKFKGPDLPVENVSWLQATAFCQKMTQMDTKPPPGGPGKYELPTLGQWKVFSAGAELKNAVYGASQPARVGSKGPSNKFGLTDVLGNVREWLADGDAKNKDFIGGSFNSYLSFGGKTGFVTPQQYQLDQVYDNLGFRVLWVPSR